MRQHPDTGWRTGDFVRRWYDSNGTRVYRVDGVLQGSTRLTLVPCCDRSAADMADGPGTACPLDLIRAIEEDMPTDEREAAILALECGQLSDAGQLGEDAYVAYNLTFERANIDSSKSDLDAGLGGFLDICLHAAALLRDGWNHGDPVEVLP